ncbi:hypothetical protein H0H81_011121 [Sphagnurus paluster]|uniref:Uncharacterized protein n=1 Tax=Sphagnurus paluster TaxID=117069 RepID=A0A9P7KNN8_9AGAR|nr:hypothetical protein H0H81_011121 [Sphagnurus paluster]
MHGHPTRSDVSSQSNSLSRTVHLDTRPEPPLANKRLSLVDSRPIRSSPLSQLAVCNEDDTSSVTISIQAPSPRPSSSQSTSSHVRFSTPELRANVLKPPSDLDHASYQRQLRKSMSMESPHRDATSASLQTFHLSPTSQLPRAHNSLNRKRPSTAPDQSPSPMSMPRYAFTAARNRDQRIRNSPSFDSGYTPSASTSQDPSKNWMTTNMYETTPRFSRLGMSAPNVVLPVSAREYRRNTIKRPSQNSVSVHEAQSYLTPSNNLVPSLRSSASSSRETLNPSNSSRTGSSTDISTVVEDNEENDIPQLLVTGTDGLQVLKVGSTEHLSSKSVDTVIIPVLPDSIIPPEPSTPPEPTLAPESALRHNKSFRYLHRVLRPRKNAVDAGDHGPVDLPTRPELQLMDEPRHDSKKSTKTRRLVTRLWKKISGGPR